VVDWGGGGSLAAAAGPIVRQRVQWTAAFSTAALLALADQLPLPMIVKRGWSGFPVDALYKNPWL